MLVFARTHGQYRSLPFLHTKNYKHYVHIDALNEFGRGHGALISQGGDNGHKGHIIAENILTFLEHHYQRLTSDYFFNGRGTIEGFCGKPELARGSVTVTNGVRIEAVAKYVHHFSQFDDDSIMNRSQYFFTYQVRISGPKDEDSSEEVADENTFY